VAQAAHLSANLFGCVRSEKPPPGFGGWFCFLIEVRNPRALLAMQRQGGAGGPGGPGGAPKH
jgi:hypothetical protein